MFLSNDLSNRLKWFSWVVLFVILFFYGKGFAYHSGGHFETSEEKQLFEIADEHFDHAEYDEAWMAVRDLLLQYPESFEGLKLLVQIAYQTNRIQDLATLSYIKYDFAGSTQSQIRAHYMRGWIALLTSDLYVARNEIDEALRLSGDNPDFELRRVSLVLDRQTPGTDFEKLAERYEALVEDYPNSALAYLSYLNLFNFDGFGSRRHKEVLERALALDEKLAQIYVRAAEMGSRELWYDPAVALDSIEDGLDEFPQSKELNSRKIQLLRQLGRTEEALELAISCQEIAPNVGEFLLSEVELLGDLNRFKEAIVRADELGRILFQPEISEQRAWLKATYAHYDGDRALASRLLVNELSARPLGIYSRQIRSFLSSLQTAPPDAQVKLLPNPQYMTQKGNYCGPASLSMILGYWKESLGQDEIAEEVYTGIAGTPPQVIHNFASSLGFSTKEFSGDQETWKELIDEGYPVLWLEMRPNGGHYMVVTGYDEVQREWILHNPHHYRRSTRDFDETADSWLLPSLNRSIVIYPEGIESSAAIAKLKPSMMLVVSNWAMYIATGANLFVQVFPGILLNFGLSFLLVYLSTRLIYSITWPRPKIRMIVFTLFCWMPFLVTILWVALTRSSSGVSILLSLHLSMITLIPLLVIIRVLRGIPGDYLGLRESGGLSLGIVVVWIVLAFIDDTRLELITPFLVLLSIAPYSFLPRFKMHRAEKMLSKQNYESALQLVKPYGSEGDCYYYALLQELDIYLMSGKPQLAQKALENLESELKQLGKKARKGLELYSISAAMLQKEFVCHDSPHSDESVSDVLPEQILSHFHLVQSELEFSGDQPPVDSILERLVDQREKTLPGIPAARQSRIRPVTQIMQYYIYKQVMDRLSQYQRPENVESVRLKWEPRLFPQLALFRVFFNTTGQEEIEKAQNENFNQITDQSIETAGPTDASTGL